MKAILRSKPLYLFLLSLFFVFHGYTENFDLVPLKDIAILLLVYIASSLILAGIFWLLFRNISRAAFLAFLLMFFYFFFGAIYDRMMILFPGSFLSKYSVILGAFGIIFIVSAIICFRTKRSLQGLNYALNIFLILLLVVDAAWLTSKMMGKQTYISPSFEKQFSVCDTCAKPDIYLVLADEYAGRQALVETMNYDNSDFDSALLSRGFELPQSLSNYNFTPFSIGSMLDMEYLEDLEGKNTSHSDLAQCYKRIRNNKVFQFLYAHGYEFYNYSIFDIHDQPSLVKETILPERTRFITAQTLFRRLENNILFNMAEKLGMGMEQKRLMLTYNSNIKVLDSTRSIIKQDHSTPRFVYTHLIMPHFPYFHDKHGNFREFKNMNVIEERNLEKYTEYLQYTNSVLLELIDEIRSNSARPTVIILVSDHGFREYPRKVDNKYLFMNMMAVSMPGSSAASMPDTLTNVNLFRWIFNEQFNQEFPLLKDSTFYISPL